MRRYGMISALALLYLAMLAGCGTTTTSQATAASSIAKLGEPVTQKEVGLTVWEVKDPAQADGAAQPAEGTRWVALDIEVRNLSAQPKDHDLTLYALIRANDSNEYKALKLGVIMPALTPVSVPPGGSQRGWLTFQMPKDKNPAFFLYAPADGSGVRMTVNLMR